MKPCRQQSNHHSPPGNGIAPPVPDGTPRDGSGPPRTGLRRRDRPRRRPGRAGPGTSPAPANRCARPGAEPALPGRRGRRLRHRPGGGARLTRGCRRAPPAPGAGTAPGHRPDPGLQRARRRAAVGAGVMCCSSPSVLHHRRLSRGSSWGHCGAQPCASGQKVTALGWACATGSRSGFPREELAEGASGKAILGATVRHHSLDLAQGLAQWHSLRYPRTLYAMAAPSRSPAAGSPAGVKQLCCSCWVHSGSGPLRCWDAHAGSAGSQLPSHAASIGPGPGAELCCGAANADQGTGTVPICHSGECGGMAAQLRGQRRKGPVLDATAWTESGDSCAVSQELSESGPCSRQQQGQRRLPGTEVHHPSPAAASSAAITFPAHEMSSLALG